jgi:non-specific serine/threonine protein kinase
VPGRPVLDALTEYLGAADTLVVLDDCEHVLGASAAAVQHILEATSTARVLATSREALNVPGEYISPVPSLQVPSSEASQAADIVGGLSSCESAQLFVDRAKSAVTGFELKSANARAVAEICRRLDGVPLAIELAAARLRLLSAQQIAERLDDRFRLLSGGSRTALARQQTLESAIGWSYDLLDDAEKRLFARLAVFVSGWSIEAAEALYDRSAGESDDVLDLLSHLVDKSLVEVRTSESPRRYRFLETIRQYARDRLAASGESSVIRGRHLDHFVGYAEDTASGLLGATQVRCHELLELEHANILAALGWALEGVADREAAERLVVALWRFWANCNYLAEADHWSTRVMDCCEGEDETERTAMVRYVAAVAANVRGDYEAAASRYEAALDGFRRFDDKAHEAWALNDLGLVHCAKGNPESAIEYLNASLTVKLELGDTRDAAVTLGNIGHVAWRQRDFERARDYYRRGLDLYEELGDDGDARGQALIQHNMAELERGNGDLATAGGMYRDSLRAAWGVHDLFLVAACVAGLGGVAAGERHGRRAARLLSAAEVLFESLERPIDEDNQQEHDRMTAAARRQLTDSEWQAARTEGRAMAVDHAAIVDYALRG